MADWQRHDPEGLRDLAVDSYRQAGGSRPDVLLLSLDGETAVLKDFSHSDTAFSRFIGPLLVFREVRSLRRLDGLTGIPRLLRPVNRKAFLLQAVPGTPCSQLAAGAVDAAFFTRLRELIDQMHARGVAHCDLRSGGNILVGHDGQPWLVDFVASIHDGSRWNLPARWLFRQFQAADTGAVVKLKQRLAPELLDTDERAWLARRRGWLERTARLIGRSVRRASRFLFTRHPG